MFPVQPPSELGEPSKHRDSSSNGSSTNRREGHNLSADHEASPAHGRDATAPKCPADRELADSRRRLANLQAIEQAKGMLMGYYGISADVAFALLRRWSLRSNTELSTVCANLVAEGSHAAEHPSGSLRRALDRWQPTNNNPPVRRVRQGPRWLTAVASSSPRPRRDIGEPLSVDARPETGLPGEVP